MNQLQGVLNRMSSPTSSPSSPKGKNDPESALVATAVSQKVLHHPLQGRQAELAATIVHYTFGAAVGGLYGLAAETAPITGLGLGIPFGASLWLLAEGAAASMQGLDYIAKSRSPASHARDLLTHAAFGLTTDLVRRSLRKTT